MYIIASLISLGLISFVFYNYYKENETVFENDTQKYWFLSIYLLFSMSALFYLYADNVKTWSYWGYYSLYIAAILSVMGGFYYYYIYKKREIPKIIENISEAKYLWCMKIHGKCFMPFVIFNLFIL